LAFDPLAYDLAHIEGLIRGAFHPLLCLVKNQTSSNQGDITPPPGTRQELEIYVLRELLERDPVYRAQSDLWARRVLHLKELALKGDSPEEIIAELRTYDAPGDTVMGTAEGV